MKNFVQDGKALELTAGAALSAGDGHQVGSIFGVAINDIASGQVGVFYTEGVFTLPKNTAIAFVEGEKVYWDSGAGEVTNVATSNLEIGVAVAAQQAADPTAKVKLGAVAQTGA